MKRGLLFAEMLKNFHNGEEYRAYEFFGCHKMENGSYIFRVWAPHAKKVYLNLQSNEYEMLRLSDGECFEVKVSAIAGDRYVFLIETVDGRKIEKCDPYAFQSDFPNSHMSVVCDLPEKAKNKALKLPHDKNKPLNIYEVNLLSWKRHSDNSYYSFDDLRDELVPYVKQMGYTHVEFMPITEYPFDGSWGYQVTGYFSVTSRLGTCLQFYNLIDAFHKNGIKVILDWVPAHFPKDDWALYEFDGQPLYECALWDRMEHRVWGTRRFDYGRAEVDSFLLSSAYFFFDVYGIDGIRVDAVASMIYLDYDKSNGDFTPNEYGDSRNLEGIEFIKKFNSIIKRDFAGAITIAEESTAFPNVTKDVSDGGLGFTYKWNMGWMNDVLFYCRQDPYFRCYHHSKMTFSLVYAFSESFILPLSHDEVVHVKGSIVNKMFGEYEDKFAGERLLLAYAYAHPGKKLNFMGYEIAQFSEWNYNGEIEFFLTEKFEKHRKMQGFVKKINSIYRKNEPLFQIDDSWDGFKWLSVDDAEKNVLAFMRFSSDGRKILAFFNFSGVDLFGYTLKTDGGKFKVLLNTDSVEFGGTGKFKRKSFNSVKLSDGEYYIKVDIPRLTGIYLINKKNN